MKKYILLLLIIYSCGAVKQPASYDFDKSVTEFLLFSLCTFIIYSMIQHPKH